MSQLLPQKNNNNYGPVKTSTTNIAQQRFNPITTQQNVTTTHVDLNNVNITREQINVIDNTTLQQQQQLQSQSQSQPQLQPQSQTQQQQSQLQLQSQQSTNYSANRIPNIATSTSPTNINSLQQQQQIGTTLQTTNINPLSQQILLEQFKQQSFANNNYLITDPIQQAYLQNAAQLGPLAINNVNNLSSFSTTTNLSQFDQVKSIQQAQRRFYPFSLFIFHLPRDIDNNGLLQLFLPYGAIACHVMRHEDGSSRGFGFVYFNTRQEADIACEIMNGYQIGHKRLKVSIKRGEDHMIPLNALHANQLNTNQLNTNTISNFNPLSIINSINTMITNMASNKNPSF